MYGVGDDKMESDILKKSSGLTLSSAIGTNGILIFPHEFHEQFLIFVSHFEWIGEWIEVILLLN